jgi:2-polyprenyl-6-methoxyphenol hydroxylase-like FAD-dependent oxidoreductase
MAAKTAIRSESGKVRRVIVVGGGLGGLMTAIKLCEAGVPVDLFSELLPFKKDTNRSGLRTLADDPYAILADAMTAVHAAAPQWHATGKAPPAGAGGEARALSH